MGWSRRSTGCVQLALCRCCSAVLKSHPSWHISSLLLWTASHSRSRYSRSFAPRHEFSADGSYCIQENIHCRDTLRISGLPQKQHYSLFCLGCQDVRTHVIASHCGFQQLHFLPSYILVPRAHTSRYPSSSWAVFCTKFWQTPPMPRLHLVSFPKSVPPFVLRQHPPSMCYADRMSFRPFSNGL